MSNFTDIKAHALEMEIADAARNLMFGEMDALYWMTWKEERLFREQMKNIKITRSPLARNSLLGAMRLLTATDPVIEVPHDINDANAVRLSSKIEKFLNAMLFVSGRISGDPIHYDAVRSALLYSEVVIGINSTKDMAKMSTIPAVKRRMEDIANRTPYLFEVWQPSGCHSERDKFGLTSFLRKIDTTAGHIEDVYGKDGISALNSGKNRKGYHRHDQVTLCTYYDLKDVCIWLDGYENQVKEEEHGLPFIPVVAQTVEGSNLFSGTGYYRQEPFLYTLDKTNLVERQNGMLTTLYTMLFSIGANPMFADFTMNPETAPESDWTEPGGTMHYRNNERREVVSKQVIDPALMEGWQISQDLEAQSTIYKQTLGEPLGSNAPYSMVALLSQSGRLPLEATQRKTSWSLAEALEIALKWMKYDNVKGRAKYLSLSEELSPEDIDSDIDVTVTLEINMPTDRLQAANAANMLTQGDNPIVSQEWVRANILNIGQTEDMTKEIWGEKAKNIFFEKFMFDRLAELAQAKQMAMQPGMASGMPGMEGGQPPMPQPPMMPGMEGMPGQMGTPPMPPSPEQMPPQEPMPPMPPALAPQMPGGG